MEDPRAENKLLWAIIEQLMLRIKALEDHLGFNK